MIYISLITNKTDEVIRINVESPAHIETVYDTEHDNLDYIYKSKVDYIYYYIVETNQMITIDVNHLQKHLRYFQNYNQTRHKYTTLGIIIAVNTLLGKGAKCLT